MNVVAHQMPLNYGHTFPFAQIFYNLADISPQFVKDNFATVLGSKYDMVFAHILCVR